MAQDSPPDSTADPDDTDTLRERVAELEQTVQQQQQTIQQLLPSRRGVIKAGGLLAGGGLLGAVGSERVAADAEGQVGTLSKPLDVIAWSLQDRSGSNMALKNVASGDIQLSSGSATVSTGVSTTGATFYPALGVQDPDADVNLAAKLFFDDSAGVWKITIDEIDTNVGNPTALYDIIRVR